MIYQQVKKRLLYFIIILSIYSCRKETTTPTTTTINNIVLNSLFTTDSLFNVSITKSFPITYGNTIPLTGNALLLQNVPNAQVYVSQNNVLIDSLSNQYYQNSSGYLTSINVQSNYWSRKIFAKPGNEYEILVKTPGLPNVTAITTVTNLVKIQRIDTSRIYIDSVLVSSNPNIYFKEFNLIINIEFTDPANEKNFYLLNVYNGFYATYSNGDSLYQSPTPFVKYLVPYTCNDPIVEEKLNYNSLLYEVAFSDKSINGKTYSLSISFNDIQYEGFVGSKLPSKPLKTIFYFRLYSITEDYFNYLQTLLLYYQNVNNPLASPTQVYSNVQGGYGIFSGASVSTDSFLLYYNNPYSNP